MKADFTTTTPEPAFHPVTISITCESQTELDALGTLFNLYPLNAAIQTVFNVSSTNLHRITSRAGADQSSKIGELRSALQKLLAPSN